jgi:hypothetical protein
LRCCRLSPSPFSTPNICAWSGSFGILDQFRREKWDVLPNFEVGPNTASKIPLVTVLCSWSIVSFYIPLALGVAIVMLVEIFVYEGGI